MNRDMQKNMVDVYGDNRNEKPCCPGCRSENVVKYGRQKNGVQRYKCKRCSKVFNVRFNTIFYRRRVDEDEILRIVYLFLTGYPIGKMPPLFLVTEKTIRDILKGVLLHFQKLQHFHSMPMNYIPEVIEIDEIYIKLQGKKKFYGWLAYDPKNKYLIDFVIGKRDDDTLEKLFKKLKRFRGKIRLVLIDGYQGYEKFISKYLGIKRKKPITGVINKSRFNHKTGKFYTYGLFGVSGKTVDEVIKELGIGKEITTSLVENLNSFIRDSIQYLVRRTKRIARELEWVILAFIGFSFFHNIVKAHWSLSTRSSKNWIDECITPGMICGVTKKPFSLFEILMIPTHQL